EPRTAARHEPRLGRRRAVRRRRPGAAGRRAAALDVLAVGGDDVDRVGVDRVGPGAARHLVDLAVAGVDRVVAGGELAPQRATVAAGQIGRDLVAPRAAGDRVVAVAAVDLVGTGAAVELVGAVAALQHIVSAAADQLTRRADLVELEIVGA